MSRFLAIFLGLAIGLGTVLALSAAEPARLTLTGHAQAVDGDTLRITGPQGAAGGARVRLWGIDAPEARQTCSRAVRAGTWATEAYACGAQSTAAFAAMLRRDPVVTCQVKATDRHGRTVALCGNSEGDLAARMVAAGHAVDVPRYSGGAYRDREAAAKAARLGIWAGAFVRPADWRRKNMGVQ